MNKKARILSLLLAAFMFVTLFAACKSDDEPNNPTPGSSNGFDLSQTNSWSDEQWLEYEKSLDFGGRTFTLATHQKMRRAPSEENPTQVDTEMDELFKQLEADLNISIDINDAIGGRSEELATWTMAGENPADVYDQRPTQWLAYAAKGQIFDWASDEAKSYGVDVNNEKLFWQDWTHAWDINGHTYAVRYASKFYPPEAGWIMLYNEDILNANGITGIEDKVRAGEWTWDYFLECAKACTKDVDGDGQFDTWGISTGYTAYGEEVVTGGGKIVDWVDGKLTCTLNTPAAVEGLSFIAQQRDSGAVMPGVGAENAGGIGYGEGHTAFAQGEVAFLYTELRLIANKAYSDEFGMRRMEDTWGVLPIPVKAGEPYRNIIGNHDTDFMLMTNKDREFSVKVYAAFARRQNDVNWKDCVAESYLQDPTDTNKADILANYVIPNITPNYQWIIDSVNDLYRGEAVYPLYDENLAPAAIAESVTPKIQALLDAFPQFPNE